MDLLHFLYKFNSSNFNNTNSCKETAINVHVVIYTYSNIKVRGRTFSSGEGDVTKRSLDAGLSRGFK